MESTLKTIQTLAKVGKVLSKIVFICCLVGAICCAVGAACLLIFGEQITLSLGSVTIHGPVEFRPDMALPLLLGSMGIAFIACLGELILARCAENFFRLELEVGTPFHFPVVKAMKKLGIQIIVIPLVTDMLCSVLQAVLTAVTAPSAAALDVSVSVSVGLGVMFLVMSVITRYGTELLQKQREQSSHIYYE